LGLSFELEVNPLADAVQLPIVLTRARFHMLTDSIGKRTVRLGLRPIVVDTRKLYVTTCNFTTTSRNVCAFLMCAKVTSYRENWRPLLRDLHQ
jgi:hypothetical protein